MHLMKKRKYEYIPKTNVIMKLFYLLIIFAFISCSSDNLQQFNQLPIKTDISQLRRLHEEVFSSPQGGSEWYTKKHILYVPPISNNYFYDFSPEQKCVTTLNNTICDENSRGKTEELNISIKNNSTSMKISIMLSDYERGFLSPTVQIFEVLDFPNQLTVLYTSVGIYIFKNYQLCKGYRSNDWGLTYFAIQQDQLNSPSFIYFLNTGKATHGKNIVTPGWREFNVEKECQNK